MGQSNEVVIGGQPIAGLQLSPGDDRFPRFSSMQVIPGRALMMLQARAELSAGRFVDVFASPSPADAARQLDGGPQDRDGNASFSFGGAVLAPFANRITGRYLAAEGVIETRVLDTLVRLPANGGGKAPDSTPYAIHGMILATPIEDLKLHEDGNEASARGVLHVGDFAGRWPSSTDLTVSWTLTATCLTLRASATNVGDEILPIGFGWHPYFALPSGRREQARVRLPAKRRIIVDNYDDVLPTGEVRSVEGGPYDFSGPSGAPLGQMYFDDCFVDLQRDPKGDVQCEIHDPAAAYGLRIRSTSSAVSALQMYAPPDKSFVVIEPQFNWANPFSSVWPDSSKTGMVLLKPRERVDYDVTVELSAP